MSQINHDLKIALPLHSYTDETNNIKYTFSVKHNTWIPDVSTYSTNDSDGKTTNLCLVKRST